MATSERALGARKDQMSEPGKEARTVARTGSAWGPKSVVGKAAGSVEMSGAAMVEASVAAQGAVKGCQTV